MSYSLDFRKQVFKIKERNKLTFEELSERFWISIRTIFRWQNRIEPIVKRNKPATKINMEALAKNVKDKPDLFLFERAKKFNVGISSMFYALQRIWVSFKKNSVSPKSRWNRKSKFPNKD